MNVADKVVIVTGAGSGIGRAIALECTGRGARVVCSGRRAERDGGLDVLVNNAGSFAAIGGSWEVDPEAWWRDVTVNLRGPMLTSVASRGRGP